MANGTKKWMLPRNKARPPDVFLLIFARRNVSASRQALLLSQPSEPPPDGGLVRAAAPPDRNRSKHLLQIGRAPAGVPTAKFEEGALEDVALKRIIANGDMAADETLPTHSSGANIPLGLGHRQLLPSFTWEHCESDPVTLCLWFRPSKNQRERQLETIYPFQYFNSPPQPCERVSANRELMAVALQYGLIEGSESIVNPKWRADPHHIITAQLSQRWRYYLDFWSEIYGDPRRMKATESRLLKSMSIEGARKVEAQIPKPYTGLGLGRCGPNTGGLIAIILGRLRMTVDECIDAYAAAA
ncbi:hypothetical protein BR93DRAFT_970621 [Coniochaeta sp. PMI_546]|nr:hypothetical protein BR93DRAFT_970621 [Coniochaeta sp. PMI_546]